VKLRVGFDARWYNDSGVGTYVAELVQAMAQLQSANGIELVVYESALDTNAETRHAASPALNIPNVERVVLRSPKYSVGEQFELARRCRLDRLNVLHCPFYVMPLAAPCPVVITIHDLIPFLFPIYSASKGLVIRTVYRVAARRAAHVITVSQHTADDVHKILRVPVARVTAIPNAANPVFTATPVTNAAQEQSFLRDKFGITGPYVMASSARNWRHKNLESALAAIELTGNEFAGDELSSSPHSGSPKFQTIVYGPPDGLIAAGGKTNLGSPGTDGRNNRWQGIALRHTGFTSAADLAILFRHARAFLMPSLYEGFGLPILEAMSCGCPVITSNGGSLPEVAGDGAQTFPPHDVQSMASALAGLLTSEETFSRWRAAALHRATQFSWLRTAQETINVYRSLSGSMVAQK
jgi:glycosyltransferase involved in cell wall biosynthesis